jgi:hypothetical protein
MANPSGFQARLQPTRNTASARSGPPPERRAGKTLRKEEQRTVSRLVLVPSSVDALAADHAVTDAAFAKQCNQRFQKIGAVESHSFQNAAARTAIPDGSIA